MPEESELPTTPPRTGTPAGPFGVAAPRPLGSGYLLLELIGSGTGGHVYRATRRADGQTVAVKVLRPEHLGDPEMVTRFLRERAALRAVDHPNLVRVQDLVAEGDTLAIVMDFVAGPNLRQLLTPDRAGPARHRQPAGDDRPDLDTGLRLLAQLAAALGAVHEAGIVHRDVKPENVLVVRRGGQPWARLTDFGIARILDSPAVTRVSQLVGTPAYVAPELVAGRAAGPAVDVYALGVTGYELLTGERPFTAPSTPELLRAHLETPPPRPSGLSEAVWQLLRGCLAKDPADRPAAAQLRAGFESLYGHAGALPGNAPPPLPPTPPPPVASLLASPVASLVEQAQPGDAPEPAPAYPPPGNADGVPEELLTMTARRPMPEAPAAPVPHRRRWPLVAALCALVLLGAGAGLWVGHARGGATPSAGSTSQSSQFGLVWLPVNVSSPKAGQILLQFTPQASTPGFSQYLVYENGNLKNNKGTPLPPPYTYSGLNRAGPHYCYRVAALFKVAEPTVAAPRPVCHPADGKPTPSTVE
ncbi:MAG: serine/threonine protein kinase [Micromonosporaceae bacterium]|nr:serine/threonine protein kinase [Micromonosporaceae bacterium]